MQYLSPGVYVEEVASGARPIEAVGTSTAGFVGVAPNAGAHVHDAKGLDNYGKFVRMYGAEESNHLSRAVYGFFQNGGPRCYIVNIGSESEITGDKKGVKVLETVDQAAIIAAPGLTGAANWDAILSHCELMKDRIAILDPPQTADIEMLTKTAVAPIRKKSGGDDGASDAVGARPRQSDGGYAAYYYPWIYVRDPMSPNDIVATPPSGHLAGIYARTDAMRGVHKAPANEAIRGAINVTYRVTRAEQEILNPVGVNCIRFFPREGIRVWGARTLAPSASDWRYINVRRLFNMIEESIANSTRWVVFEPNDEALWKAITRDVSAFLNLLWRQGAIRGSTPDQAYFVQCDAETNPDEVIDAGQVVVRVGIAPVKPAEFVVFRIGQSAAGSSIETADAGVA